MAKRKPCRVCGIVADDGYCQRHPKPKARDKPGRLSSTARGYDYRWEQFSKEYRRAHPFCVDCQARGVVAQSSEVHHVVKISEDPTLKFDLDNLMALCGPCHDLRSGRGE